MTFYLNLWILEIPKVCFFLFHQSNIRIVRRPSTQRWKYEYRLAEQFHVNYRKLTTKTSCKQKSKRSKETNFFQFYLLRADPNVLLIKTETTRPHYSSSFSRRFCCPLFNATREQSFELLPVTLVHAFYIFLLSTEPFTLPSLLPLGCLCSSHRLFPSITGFALHARITTHGTHGDAFSHHLRSLSSNALPSRSIKFLPFNSFASTSLLANCDHSYCIVRSYEIRKLSRNIIL